MGDRHEAVETIEIASLGRAGQELRARLLSASRPLILLDGAEPVAVLLEPDCMRRLVDERELLRRLALGELESAAGEGVSLESVLDECDRLLEEA